MTRSRGTCDEVERFAQDVDLLLADQPVAETSDDAYQADLALAHLLSRGQFVPDPRFKGCLRSQLLNQLDGERKELRTMSPMKVFRSLARSVLVASLSAVIVLGIVLAVSPDARAAAQKMWVHFVEVDSPWALLPTSDRQAATPTNLASHDGEDEPAHNQTAEDESGTGSGIGQLPGMDNQGVETEPGKLPVPDVQPGRELISLEEAQAKLDFKIPVPSTLPEGYAFLGVAAMPDLPSRMPSGAEPPADLPKVKPPQVAILVFGTSDDEVLILSEALLNNPVPAEVPLPAGEGSVQEVMVDGQPAQYIEGLWTPNGWTTEGNRQLHWQAEGIMFDLISSTLGLNDLLAVAESVD